MSVVEYDIIVIGAGVAGLTAGAALAGRGYRVALVTTGEPTACLSTGCIDLCAAGDHPLEALASLPDLHPFHLVPQDKIVQAFTNFKETMAHMGFPYTGAPEQNRLILSALGTFKTTCLSPLTMQASVQSDREEFHVISFVGLKDFYPSYILSRCPRTACSIYDAGVITTMGIAAKFEDEAFLESFILWLERLDIRQNKIAVPAVLGLESSLDIIKKIEYRLERPVFEIPTIPPSMPGRRLFNALKDDFRSRGGDIYWSWPVIGMEKAGRVVEAVFTHPRGKPNSLNARAFILASGSFVGGGLSALRGSITENVFNLPVYIPGPKESWFEDDYFSPDHRIGKAGVIADSTFRPANAPWENIFVCGGILAHAEMLKNGCGHGLALSTGWAAAGACAEYLR